MTRPDDPGRRRFLASAGRAALGLAAGSVVLPAAGCARGEALLDALLGFYPDRDAAAAVGARFLERFPKEDDAPELVRRLARSRERQGEWEALAVAAPASLHAALRGSHRSDFAEGRIVLLRGWILSQTEARLCALVARSG